MAHGGIDLYLKDESTHPTGSLKHRLARSLFLYALCNGWMHEGSTIVEASSGSTAVSEAYFARLLGLPFVAVMPRSTSPEKIAQIEFHGGALPFRGQRGRRCTTRPAPWPRRRGGHYMDQFTYAERATDWRGNNNIAESMFTQMARERHPVPRWIVVGAGTGGTSATIGRYVRYQRHATQVCVADPEGSVFGAYHRTGDAQPHRARLAHRGHRPAAGGAQLHPHAGRPHGGGARRGLDRGHARAVAAAGAPRRPVHRHQLCRPCSRWPARCASGGESGSILSLLCDAGERYLPTYFDADWVARCFGDCAPAQQKIDTLLA